MRSYQWRQRGTTSGHNLEVEMARFVLYMENKGNREIKDAYMIWLDHLVEWWCILLKLEV